MKKLLLVSTAIAGVALLSSPASAALKMDLGGYFDFYGVYADNHPLAGTDLHKYDFRRQSDFFVNGESTLDNGLTVGAHSDIDVGNNNAAGTNNAGTNTVTLNEVYGYGSGQWGRVNLGLAQDAGYLLQVAAPSADSNVDGLKSTISAAAPSYNGVGVQQDPRLATLLGNPAGIAGNQDAFGAVTSGQLEYAQEDFRQTDRVTYLTPKFNGFQAGVSYAPTPGIASATGAQGVTNTAIAPALAGQATPFKNLWSAGARWDGHFSGADLSLGGGYSGSSLDATNGIPVLGGVALTDGVKTWNLGGNAGFAGFSLGGAYKESKVDEEASPEGGVAHNVTGQVEDKTYVAGLAYDNGPYHVGGSYLHDHTTDPSFANAIGTTGDWMTGQNVTDTRWTLGGGYTFGPGMTFRGAVSWGKFQNTETGVGTGVAAAGTQIEANGSNRYDQVTVGTDIQF